MTLVKNISPNRFRKTGGGYIEPGASEDVTIGANETAAINRHELVVVGDAPYKAGVSGTVSIPEGHRVTTITAIAGTGAATIVIQGGDSISIPAGASFTDDPDITGRGDTDVVFSNTASYYVAWEA